MAVVKPTEYPDFATNPPVGSSEKPDDAKQVTGWNEGEEPPFQHFNWLHKLYGAWIRWLEDAIITVSTTLSNVSDFTQDAISDVEDDVIALDSRLTSAEDRITDLEGDSAGKLALLGTVVFVGGGYAGSVMSASYTGALPDLIVLTQGSKSYVPVFFEKPNSSTISVTLGVATSTGTVTAKLYGIS